MLTRIYYLILFYRVLNKTHDMLEYRWQGEIRDVVIYGNVKRFVLRYLVTCLDFFRLLRVIKQSFVGLHVDDIFLYSFRIENVVGTRKWY